MEFTTIKKILFSLFLLLSGYHFASAQIWKQEVKYNDPQEPKSIGIVMYSNDPETVFNAFRFANYAQEWDNKVEIFLLGKGVETEKLMEENKDVKEQVDKFIDQGGVIMGCKTCLQNREKSESKICRVTCIEDLYNVVKKNQIVLTF
ncbi:MAG: DsrE family protein [Paludibacteraceae bacterium]|nr:DsrE family protein [Paludibacteraceae bacterium]